MTEDRRTRWQQLTGGTTGSDYAQQFARLAAAGEDVHGEAALVAGLVPRAARVLDAGCGTGRVAIRLAELGYDCVGVDADESMLAVARDLAPGLPWVLADLAAPDEAALIAAGRGTGPFDLVVLAGNVIPLLAPGTLTDAVGSLARLVAPGGLLVAGFGLDAGHLPSGCPVTPLEDYDAAAADAGLIVLDRFSTWQAAPYDADEGYVVSVHRR